MQLLQRFSATVSAAQLSGVLRRVLTRALDRDPETGAGVLTGVD